MHPAILLALAPALSAAAVQAQMPKAPHAQLPASYDTTVVAHCERGDVSLTLRSTAKGVTAVRFEADGRVRDQVRDRITAELAGVLSLATLQISCGSAVGETDYVWVYGFETRTPGAPAALASTHLYINGPLVTAVR